MFTIKEVLLTEQLHGIRLKAGAKGSNRIVKTVTIMDIPEIIDWLQGGELVISGVLFEQYFSKELVDAFFKKNIAGIVTKEKFTYHISPDLLAYCDEIGFPIILAPTYFSWEQIMNPILNGIIRKPYQLIEESQRIHFSLINAMIDGVSLSEVCTMFYGSTGLGHAIMDSDLYLIGSSDDIDWKNYTRSIDTDTLEYSDIYIRTPDNNHVRTYYYQNDALRKLSMKLILFPILLKQINYGYVVLAVDESLTDLPQEEVIKIQQLGPIVALHVKKVTEIGNATRRFNQLLMEQLLQEPDLSQKQAEALLMPTGKKIHRRYFTVHLLYKKLENINSFIQQNNSLSRFHDILEKKLNQSKHILIFEKLNMQVLLIPYPTEELDILLRRIRRIFLSTTGLSQVYIGISDPTPLSEIKHAFVQSERTARYLMAINSEISYYRYQDLGVLKYFMNDQGKLSEAFINEVYEKFITPLIAYDKTHRTKLLHTLNTYISNNYSKTQTEKTLHIHKNTLIARFNTISKLLDCDIQLAENFFNIQLALKIHHSLMVTQKHHTDG